MPEAHEPPLDLPRPQWRRRSLAWLALEVALIASGVFLGLAGEQWRQNAQGRELAETSLRRLRAEIVTNRRAVAAVADYHTATLKALKAYLAVPVPQRRSEDLSIEGIRSVFFEDTAWDLTLATQSLVNIDSDLAYELSRAYNAQRMYESLTAGLTQAMYVQNPTDQLDGFAGALALYYDDLQFIEPGLLKMYDALIPQIDRALND